MRGKINLANKKIYTNIFYCIIQQVGKKKKELVIIENIKKAVKFQVLTLKEPLELRRGHKKKPFYY